MAIDLSEQSITPNTDLFSAGLADNSKSFYIHPSIHPSSIHAYPHLDLFTI